MSNHHSIPQKLSEATSLVAESLQDAGHAERVEMTYELIEANECGVALENLCSNLHEFACPIPHKAYALIKEVGDATNVNSSYWLMLQSQIIS
ncbi:MAG: MafI family immunity protein [Pyrinomonadaceae bacterium]